jgi:hypothetical protein
MAIVRTLSNGLKVTDWTKEVLEIDNQYGLINSMNLFTSKGTSQESVIFEKEYRTSTLIPQTSRRGKPHSKGKDRQSEVFSLALPYFSHEDDITASDIQGKFKLGEAGGAQDLASAIAIKMEDMRVNVDQTREFMKISAIKGHTIDAEGHEIADMFKQFGLTESDMKIEWELSDPAFNVDGAIRKLKRTLAKNAKTGGAIGGFTLLVSPTFFDALVNNHKIREAYMQYAVIGANSDVIRGNLQTYETWGVVDHFVHQGVTFLSYDAEFNLDISDNEYNDNKPSNFPKAENGVVPAIGENEAHVMVTGLRDLYRGYHGPANTLSGANRVGKEMFMYQWNDPHDKFITMEIEMSPLFVCMKPQLCVTVVAT